MRVSRGIISSLDQGYSSHHPPWTRKIRLVHPNAPLQEENDVPNVLAQYNICSRRAFNINGHPRDSHIPALMIREGKPMRHHKLVEPRADRLLPSSLATVNAAPAA